MNFKELRTILKTQKYPKMIFEKGIEKALTISQEGPRSQKLKNRDDISPFISTYNPNNPTVFPKVREMYGNLRTSKTLGKIFAKHIVIDCKRQLSNLKRLLCSSTNKPTFRTRKCEKIYFCWDYIIETELFKFSHCHQPFILKSNFSSKAPKFICVIRCNVCSKKYIGQTRGQLKKETQYLQTAPSAT